MSEDEIRNICKKYNIENYQIKSDTSVDVNGDVYLYDKNLTNLPLKFGVVTGKFWCWRNKLTTLEGCPKYVESFDCSNNKLTTLEHCPSYVGGDFYCAYNELDNFRQPIMSINLSKIKIMSKLFWKF